MAAPAHPSSSSSPAVAPRSVGPCTCEHCARIATSGSATTRLPTCMPADDMAVVLHFLTHAVMQADTFSQLANYLLEMLGSTTMDALVVDVKRNATVSAIPTASPRRPQPISYGGAQIDAAALAQAAAPGPRSQLQAAVATGRELALYAPAWHGGMRTFLAAPSPADGSTLLYIACGNVVRIIHHATGGCISELHNHRHFSSWTPKGLALSPDGVRLAVVSDQPYGSGDSSCVLTFDVWSQQTPSMTPLHLADGGVAFHRQRGGVNGDRVFAVCDGEVVIVGRREEDGWSDVAYGIQTINGAMVVNTILVHGDWLFAGGSTNSVDTPFARSAVVIVWDLATDTLVCRPHVRGNITKAMALQTSSEGDGCRGGVLFVCGASFLEAFEMPSGRPLDIRHGLGRLIDGMSYSDGYRLCALAVCNDVLYVGEPQAIMPIPLWPLVPWQPTDAVHARFPAAFRGGIVAALSAWRRPNTQFWRLPFELVCCAMELATAVQDVVVRR